jgi:hypothetical protein
MPMNDRLAVPKPEAGWHYRWVNTKDHVVRERLSQGFEFVQEPDSQLPPGTAVALGQQTGNPASGGSVTRGDVVLMRMRNEAFEERVATPKREARERQKASFDTMVAQNNENAQRLMRAAGLRSVPKQVVYETSDEASFDEDSQKK